jgi:2,3,4,5-tetrahydropyridine-2,6-dicarboxylate N-succinyltransferase
VSPEVEELESRISALWERRGELSPLDSDAREVVERVVDLLDSGQARVAELDERSDTVVVHEWLRRAILLLFRLSEVSTYEHGPFEYADKLPLKHGYARAGVRVVPGASVRRGAFIDRDVVLMPSYVNIGARIGASSMIDTWATVGSCAQVGERVHVSGGVGIGGVLEPENASPVFIEDDVLIGSRSMVTQGARVGRGAVLAEGTILNPSIPVIDSWSGDELGRGYVPPWTVAVGAMRLRRFPGGDFFLPCVLVVRHLTPGERHDKALLNEILRAHEATT